MIETLIRIISRIMQEPNNEKIRKIKMRSNTFRTRIANVKGGTEFMNTIGFKKIVFEFEEWMVLEVYNEQNLTVGIDVLNYQLNIMEKREIKSPSRIAQAKAEQEQVEKIMLQYKEDRDRINERRNGGNNVVQPVEETANA
eukprot:CAMPEP_0168530486 /NCGR_PEP_ID=MMETSP0405-20121227/14709_1 /TAXON_ID=498012 /ORGANISM="Trichosphaerium sp, Strain Am-I-7 wt" /LENGTH=140 /DNA_ID=CAMNT_0008554763 /DNA_START=121 /DNA_END=540 /DNA_ORIENTATION=+